MKNLSQKYINSIIENNVSVLATCFHIELKNGVKLGFTTYSENIKFIDDDIVYQTASFTPTATSQSNEMNVDNLDIDLIIDDEFILEDDIDTGILSGARVYTFRVNPTLQPLSKLDIEKTLTGFIGNIVKEKKVYKCEFRSLTQPLQNQIIDVTKSNCGVDFCSSKCGLIEEEHSFYSTIEHVINRSSFIIADLQNEDFDFNNGKITFIKNNHNVEIKNWTKNDRTLTTLLNVFYDVEVGDQVKIVRGCDKRKETCKNKFNNVINFRGFSFIPGINKMNK